MPPRPYCGSAALSAAEPKVAVPRPAATILVVRDDPFEVLMIRRHKNQSFSSALVFPGGTVDDSDGSDDWLPLLVGAERLAPRQRALRVAAFRETFEESAMLLARRHDGSWIDTPECDRTAPFIETVRASGARLLLDDLVPFGHWITPAGAPKRFDTHFFLCAAAPDQVARCDGSEAVALEWATPASILDRAAAGETSILFPTRMNISRLAESDNVAQALAAARQRPVFTVEPRTEKREGGMAVVIPAEAGYPETENFHPHAPRSR